MYSDFRYLSAVTIVQQVCYVPTEIDGQEQFLRQLHDKDLLKG